MAGSTFYNCIVSASYSLVLDFAYIKEKKKKKIDLRGHRLFASLYNGTSR